MRDPRSAVVRSRPAASRLGPAALVALLTLAGEPTAAESYPVVVLRGLDKVTARVSIVQAPVGQPVRFGTLQITSRHCDKRPPEEPPESSAFLEVVEQREGQPQREVFSGWMFASSPGLSAIQHPVYDLWLLDCVDSAASEDSSSAPPSPE